MYHIASKEGGGGFIRQKQFTPIDVMSPGKLPKEKSHEFLSSFLSNPENLVHLLCSDFIFRIKIY